MLEISSQHKEVSSQIVRKQVKSKSGASFFEQAATFVETLRKQGKYNRVSTEQPRINRFQEFLKGKDIAFADITVPLITKFKAYLKGTRQVGERTIMNHLITIRTIYNQGIAEGLVEVKHYPFGKGKIKIKLPDSIKIGLNIEEVKLLEEVDLSQNSRLEHARGLWLLSFHFAGMRVSDVLRLKWADFQNDRLHYKMGKNEKTGSLKVSDKVRTILNQYPKNGRHDLIFPELQVLENLKDTKGKSASRSLKRRSFFTTAIPLRLIYNNTSVTPFNYGRTKHLRSARVSKTF